MTVSVSGVPAISEGVSTLTRMPSRFASMARAFENMTIAAMAAPMIVSPGVADYKGAGLLGCAEGSPVLLINRVTFTPEDRAVEATHLVFAGDRYEYRVELFRPSGVAR